MAVGYVTSQSTSLLSSGSSDTVFTSVDFTGANFALLLIASDGSDQATGCTINGVTAPLAFRTGNTGGGFTGMAAYALASPTNGNVVVTSATGKNWAVGLALFSGCNTGTPMGTWVETGDQSASSATTGTITGVDTSGMFVGFTNYYGTGAITPNGGETQVITKIFGNITLGVTTKAGAASTTTGGSCVGATHTNTSGVYLNASAASADQPYNLNSVMQPFLAQ